MRIIKRFFNIIALVVTTSICSCAPTPIQLVLDLDESVQNIKDANVTINIEDVSYECSNLHSLFNSFAPYNN